MKRVFHIRTVGNINEEEQFQPTRCGFTRDTEKVLSVYYYRRERTKKRWCRACAALIDVPSEKAKGFSKGKNQKIDHRMDYTDKTKVDIKQRIVTAFENHGKLRFIKLKSLKILNAYKPRAISKGLADLFDNQTVVVVPNFEDMRTTYYALGYTVNYPTVRTIRTGTTIQRNGDVTA